MGSYSYESYSKKGVTNNNQSGGKKDFPKIGYFWLGEKKQTAIVRFDVASGNDLVIADVHNVKVTTSYGTAWRNVACLRSDDSEPWKNCPLCSKDIKSRTTKVFVRMLEYSIVDGKVVATPVCWARYKSFADELMSDLNDYGDLRDHLFKVTWKNTNGKTTYTVKLQPEGGMYTEEAGYVKDFSAFKGFLPNKHSYMERTFDELEEFVKTGQMASRKPANESAQEAPAKAKAEVVEAPVATPKAEDVAPKAVVPSEEPVRVHQSVAEDDNPVTSRRKRYDFSDDETPF